MDKPIHHPNSIFEAFKDLEDPRRKRNQIHNLFDLITISILGILCGADDWVAINLWASCNLSWLQEYGICVRGVPSHDTLGRFFRYVAPVAFEKCFVQWTQSIAGAIKGVIAIDGKTLRGSNDLTRDGKAVHIVSAFAAENCLILGQLATDMKSNEITAIPLLLRMLDIRGATVTIDAAGCQKEIAKEIRSLGADYILALKGNQGNLNAEAANFFDQALQVTPKEAGCDYSESVEKNRGRLEKREIWITQELDWLPQREDWVDLNALICIKSTRKIKDKETVEMRYYIASGKTNAQGYGSGIRAHWGIENKVHWQLDVSYGEDKSTVRKDNGPENLSVLKRCTMNLLKADTETKAGIKNKRAKAGWSKEYMMSLLNGK
jgi:predicted transposase YbfD/YdcC